MENWLSCKTRRLVSGAFSPFGQEACSGARRRCQENHDVTASLGRQRNSRLDVLQEINTLAMVHFQRECYISSRWNCSGIRGRGEKFPVMSSASQRNQSWLTCRGGGNEFRSAAGRAQFPKLERVLPWQPHPSIHSRRSDWLSSPHRSPTTRSVTCLNTPGWPFAQLRFGEEQCKVSPRANQYAKSSLTYMLEVTPR